MMIDTLIFAGLVMAITQIFKKAFAVTSRFVPLLALIVGIVLFAIAYLATPGMVITWEGLSQILLSVLSAMGLYSGTTKTLGQ